MFTGFVVGSQSEEARRVQFSWACQTLEKARFVLFSWACNSQALDSKLIQLLKIARVDGMVLDMCHTLFSVSSDTAILSTYILGLNL